MLAKLITSVSALVCVGVSASNAASQISRPEIRPEQRLEEFLAQVVPTGNSRAEEFRLTLSFLPSFHPECRIVVVGKLHSDTTVYYQTSEKPILKTMAASQAEGKDFGIGDLVRVAGVRSTTLPLSREQAKSWLVKLASAFSSVVGQTEHSLVGATASNGILVHLDGTLYTATLEIGETRLSAVVTGSEIDEPAADDDPPMVRVMNSVRSQVASLSKLQKP